MLAAAPEARAQSKEDIVNADALFNAAKALLDAGQVTDACAKFAESKRLAPGLGVTLYLADCYERIGRTASAWTEFRAAEGLARERSDRRAEVARARAETLEPKLERLTIDVTPTVPRAGLRILLDGGAVAAEEWGLPMAVDPGNHVVIAAAPNHPDRTSRRPRCELRRLKSRLRPNRRRRRHRRRLWLPLPPRPGLRRLRPRKIHLSKAERLFDGRASALAHSVWSASASAPHLD
jgi:hypothetical protein